jgi:hypothetical protein
MHEAIIILWSFLTAVWVPWHTHARYTVVFVAPMAPPPEFEFGGRAADDTGKRRTRLPQTCLARVLICSTGTFGPFLSGSMDRSNGRQTVLTPAYHSINTGT